MVLYKIGSPKSEIVKQIQKALHLYPDGVFGPITKNAVEEFQRKNNLKVDGIVGPATLAKLIPQRLKKSKRNITEIIVHCTATPEGRNTTVEEITQWHKQRHFATIGYHYVVYLDGTIHEGRDADIAGAHCLNHNTNSIGVCYVGGMDKNNKKAKDTRTELQKNALLNLLIDLKALYPKATIHGHRDFANKDCPSFNATLEYKRL